MSEHPTGPRASDRQPFDRRQLEADLDALSSKTVGVVGDFCLDIYLFTDRSRAETSIETGLQTSPVTKTRTSPGGAGNVAANLAALGFGRVVAYGAAAQDLHGVELQRVLEGANVATERLITQSQDWETQTYMKVIENRRERDRFDFGVANRLSDESRRALLSAIRADRKSLDALVINQQLTTGIHTDAFRSELAALLADVEDLLIIVDSRDYAGSYGTAVRKLNAHEAARYRGNEIPPDRPIPLGEARASARTLALEWRCAIVVTVGADGCFVADGEETRHLLGVHHIEELDTVGAGDAMLAGLCAGLCLGMPLSSAALLGNLDAAVSVRKLFQTGITTKAELLDSATCPDFRYNPRLIEPGYRRNYAGTIEVLEDDAPSDVRYAVFDHDGTISTIRQGWEPVMLETMMSAILGRFDGEGEEVDPATYADIEVACREFIESTTGVQTLVQMEGLRGLVERFGLARRVRTAAEYKELYNRELMEFVNRRLVAFESGRLSTAELTMLGAVEFLRKLAERGVRLYLASGTDVEDVRREATALGYAELFEGRIYGATGDVRSEPKREALRAILADIESSGGGSVVTFGDGPVEMRETRKSGGFCVGIASDEVRRFGFNEGKRNRLVLAGAHILIPDFGAADELSAYLFSERADGKEGRNE